MANFTQTTNYSFKKPTVGADTDQWGSHLNETIDGVDSQLKTLADSITTQQLEQLGNVVNVTPVDDQFLRYNGTNWSAETVPIPDALNDLSNVSGTPSSGDVLTYNGSAWSPASVTSAAVADGSVTNAKLHPSLQTVIGRILVTDDDDSPTDNQILVYSTSDAEWKYADQAGSTLQTLTDVSTTGLSDGDLMKYDGTSGEFVFIDAAAARTLLNVDVSGTDNSTAVTLNTTSHDYLTLSSQQLTLGPIVLTDDVSGTLPIANGGTSATTAAGARTALGLAIGTDVQAYDADTTKNDVSNTFSANQVISVADNTNAALRITQTGTGNALVVEDSSSDSTSFIIDANGIARFGTGTIVLSHPTASTAKYPRIYAYEYDGSTQMNVLGVNADSSDNLLVIGGGSTGTTASTRINFYTANSISTASGTLRMSIDNSGNVGIGTNSPAQKLDVTGNINATGALTLGTALAIAEGGTGATTAAAARIALLPTLGTAGQVLAVNTGTTDVEWVDPATGGGSGTVTSVAISGTDGIEVDSGSPITTSGTIALGINAATLSSHLSLGTAATTALTDYATAAQGVLAGSAVQPGDDADTLGSGAATDGYVLTADGAGGTAWEEVLAVQTNTTNTFTANQIISVSDNTNAALRITQTGTGNALVVEDDTSTDSTPFVVDANGRVGIKTNSPVADLDVRNSISMGDGTSVTQILMTRSTANYIAATDVNGYLVFRTGGFTERMRIDSAGNVGIGTDAPTEKLDVTGNINVTGGLTLGTALAVAEGGTGVTSLESLDAADLGSGAATDGYVLTADGAGGTAWEAASGGGGGTTAYVEHSSTISDSFTVSSGTNRMYIGGTTFSGTISVAGRLVIVGGEANFTGTINTTGVLAILGVP